MNFERPKTPEELKLEIEQLRLENEYLSREKERLEELSTKDPLTGLYNRRGFEEAVAKIIPDVSAEKEKRGKEGSKKSVSLLLLDIDNFKEINDLYGHDTGDEILKKASLLLNEGTREHDLVARWGGEEFLVAFNGADEQDIVNKFYNKESRRPEINLETEIKGEKVTVTFSGGIAGLNAGEKFEDSLTRADEALSLSKGKGKNQISRWNDEDAK